MGGLKGRTILRLLHYIIPVVARMKGRSEVYYFENNPSGKSG
jgi:hypothetical protein